jgi:hypothetical protein
VNSLTHGEPGCAIIFQCRPKSQLRATSNSGQRRASAGDWRAGWRDLRAQPFPGVAILIRACSAS